MFDFNGPQKKRQEIAKSILGSYSEDSIVKSIDESLSSKESEKQKESEEDEQQ